MKKNVGYTVSYGADMQCLFQLLLNREKDVVEVHMLLVRMFLCIWYRRQYEKAESMEQKKDILKSVELADTDLNQLMNAWCLLISERNLILSLVRNSV